MRTGNEYGVPRFPDSHGMVSPDSHGNEFYDHDSPPGFGRTDGGIVDEEFLPPWEE